MAKALPADRTHCVPEQMVAQVAELWGSQIGCRQAPKRPAMAGRAEVVLREERVTRHQRWLCCIELPLPETLPRPREED